MAEIKNSGVPNKRTVGALGDIYVDTATGLKYKCTGATTIAGQSDYDWTRLQTSGPNPATKPEVKEAPKQVIKEEPKPVVKEEKPEEVPVETKPEVKPVASAETTPIKTPKQPKRERTNYNKQYNNK